MSDTFVAKRCYAALVTSRTGRTFLPVPLTTAGGMKETVQLLRAAMAVLLLCLLAGCAGDGQQQEAERQPTSISGTSMQPTEHSTASVDTTEHTTSSAEAQVTAIQPTEHTTSSAEAQATDQIPECSGLNTFRYPMLYVPTISNGKIALARNPSPGDANSEIYVMNADATNRSRLTNTPALEYTPTLSPDGKKIAFIRQCDTYDVYIMDADGTNQTRLFNVELDVTVPVFSPDSKKLALSLENRIYVINTDGTNETSPTRTPIGTAPVWSPDGTKIAFASTQYVREQENRTSSAGVAANTFDVYVMNADGTNQTRLTTGPYDEGYPDWSPDGKKIAFLYEHLGGNNEIYVMNADGTNQIRLTNTSGIEWGPAWSPDGKKIAFVSNRDGDYDDYRLYIMNADGSGQTRLTSEVRVALEGPTFSPSGEKITFIGSRGGDYNDSGIYVMNTDGTGLTHLTNIV